MMTTINQPWARTRQFIIFLFLSSCLCFTALNAAPTAGTEIGNQASATYTDGSNTARSTTSNVVITTVLPVYSLSLNADGSDFGTPSSTVYFPHTLINTGNIEDSFTVAIIDDPAATDSIDYASLAVYADLNGDGIADDNVNLNGTSVLLQPGDTFQFVTAGTVPSSATNGQTIDLQVTATSVGDAGVTSFDVDTTTVTTQAIIDVTKSFDSATAVADGTTAYTVTLDYANNGFATATTVTLVDDLAAAGLTYVGGSAVWSVTGAGVDLTDANNTDTQGTDPTISYDWNVTTANNVTAEISSIAPGQTGTLTFDVTVASGTVPGDLVNTATVSYDDGSGTIRNGVSNDAIITALAVINVDANDSGSTTDVTSGDDIVEVATANQGETVTFDNVITNTGTGTDTFNIVMTDAGIPGGGFPTGTSFNLFKSDGVTPLIDTNTDGIPDTGPLAPNAIYHVIVKVSLPIGFAGTGPFDVTKTATSVADSGVSDSVIDRLGTIAASTVDMTNDDVSPSTTPGTDSPGEGVGPEATAVTTLAADPGTTASFDLYVNNTSGVSDNFDLSYVLNATVANEYDVSNVTVTFRDGASGNVITNTGNINAGGQAYVIADVTFPVGYTSTADVGDTDGLNIYFTVTSTSTGATDTKHDSVTINTQNALQLTADNTGQTFPGGNVVYTHTLTNNGNTTETAIALSLSGTSAGFSSIIYLDANGDGVLDSNDTVVTSIASLVPGASETLFVVIQANAGTAIGDTDVTVITATAASTATDSDTDTTTVVPDDLVLLKKQALDADCDGLISDETVTTYSVNAISAEPNQCIMYEITATNSGSVNVDDVVINDTTPAFTSLITAPAITAVGSITSPVTPTLAVPAAGAVDYTPGYTGVITATVGTLTPAQNTVLTFGVLVDAVPVVQP